MNRRIFVLKVLKHISIYHIDNSNKKMTLDLFKDQMSITKK